MKKEVFNLRENKEFRKDYYKNYIQEKFNQTLANFET
jgi:hypothetical protein